MEHFFVPFMTMEHFYVPYIAMEHFFVPYKVIQNLAPKSSSGFDKISNKLLFIAPTIMQPLTAAINHS
jgi:hypothetical protein